MVVLFEPVPGPPGSGTFAMPFHDPHELSTNATMTSASARLAIRLNLDNLGMLIVLPQRVAAALREQVQPGRQVRDRGQARTSATAHHPGRPGSRRVRVQAAGPAADTTAAA